MSYGHIGRLDVIFLIVLAFLFFLEVAIWLDDGLLVFLLFPIMLAVPIVVLVLLILSILRIRRRQIRSGVSLALTIPVWIFMLGFPSFLFGFSGVYSGYSEFVAYSIKLGLNEEQYLKEIMVVQADSDGYRYKAFDWGGFMLNPVDLIYDESDELALPPERRSKAWWKKVERSEFVACTHSAKKLKAHFYVVRFGC